MTSAEGPLRDAFRMGGGAHVYPKSLGLDLTERRLAMYDETVLGRAVVSKRCSHKTVFQRCGRDRRCLSQRTTLEPAPCSSPSCHLTLNHTPWEQLRGTRATTE